MLPVSRSNKSGTSLDLNSVRKRQTAFDAPSREKSEFDQIELLHTPLIGALGINRRYRRKLGWSVTR